MKSRIQILFMSAASLIIFIQSCSIHKSKSSNIKKIPGKEIMIDDLYSLLSNISNKDYKAAISQLKIKDDIAEKELERIISDLISHQEISAEGLAIFEKEGKFGKLRDVFPDRADNFLKRAEISNETNCYGLRYNQAEAAGVWNGEHFIFFRIDDIGKLAKDY